MSVALAFAAALMFAVGTVLQERVASAATTAEAMRAGFLARLARQPLWLAGIAADAVGFVCQAAALGLGRIVVVQPLLASSVVFALPLGVVLAGHRIGRGAWLAAGIVTAALAAFLAIGDPSGGRDDATAAGWLISAASVATLSAALVLAAARRPPAARGALLGTATGLLFALSAALTKATVERLDDGLLAVVANWHVFALIAVGYASMALSQASLQTGALAAAVATQMVLDPVASLALGMAAFDERLHETTTGVLGSLLAVAVMLGGLVALVAASAEPRPTVTDRCPATVPGRSP
jgi:drug/metabolite transporter (DMT)-like permease